MTATSDMIIERRRVRRRLAFWRILAIIALVVIVALVLPRPSIGGRSDQIARIWISGLITENADRDAMIEKIARTDHVKALIVRINSPGGTVAGSEALYESLRIVAEKKPVVAVMAEAAASGGYVTAIASEHIVARGNTLTGSIGVVAEIPNIAGLLEMVGVEVNRVKSAPLKAEPSLTSAPTPEGLAQQQELIEDSYAWFKGLVAARRGLDAATLATVSDGRAFTGRQARELGLIDAIGGEREARDYLAATHDLSTDTPVIDWRWDRESLPWPLSQFDETAHVLGLADGFLVRGPQLYAVIQ